MSWHADPELLESYAEGTIDAARAFSLEAHLIACPDCRGRTAALVDEVRVDLVWEEVQTSIDTPRPTPVERVLLRLRVPDHLARVLAATPSLTLSWFLAIGLALGFAVIAAHQGPNGLVLFLAVAPLLPLAGVAVAYGPRIDPLNEIALVAPLSNLRLLLIRACAVLVSTAALAAAAALAVPELGGWAAAWLLPALGLTVMSLALSTSLAPVVASGSLAIAWVAAVVVGAAAADDRLAAFRPPVQIAFAVLAVVAALVVLRRRESFETAREI